MLENVRGAYWRSGEELVERALTSCESGEPQQAQLPSQLPSYCTSICYEYCQSFRQDWAWPNGGQCMEPFIEVELVP